MQSSTFSDAGATARVFGHFITWLQEKSKPVFVVATANNVSLLPPEMLRKGRFDEIFYVDLPNRLERREIFKIHIEKRKRDSSAFDLDLLSQHSEGSSGSEIEQAVISALYDAFEAGRSSPRNASCRPSGKWCPCRAPWKRRSVNCAPGPKGAPAGPPFP